MASSFVIGQPSEVPHYDLKRLPDGRWHLEHYTKLKSASAVVPALLEPWGTLYRGDTSAGTNVEAFAGLRLIDGGIQRVRLDGGSEECVVRIYEQIPETEEIQVGKTKLLIDENNRTEAVAEFLQFSAAPATPQTPGEDTAPGLDMLVLRREEAPDDGCLRRITRSYILATDQWEPVGPDITDRDMNGLLRVRRTLIARAGTPPPDLTVGNATLIYGANPSATPPVVGTTCYLGTYTTEGSTRAADRILASYLQPGVIRKRRSPGPVANTIENTWFAWRVDPTDNAAMTAAGAGAVMPGELRETDQDNVKGFAVNTYTTISGSITGVKATYKDVAEVEVPGTLSVSTVSITDPAGSVAMPNHVPPRSKRIPVTVTIEIQAAPPNTAFTPAYDLGAVSCALQSLQWSYAALGTDVFETASGGIRFSGQKYRTSLSADIQTFPGCYITGDASATGTVSYVGGYENTSTNPNSLLTNALTSTTTTKLTATGATSATGYATSGILSRRARPAFSTLAATYWEVVTITA